MARGALTVFHRQFPAMLRALTHPPLHPWLQREEASSGRRAPMDWLIIPDVEADGEFLRAFTD